MKSPDKSTVIICGIVRNAADGLKRNIPAVDQICSRFKDYRVVIFENDSTDGTKEILRDWQSRFMGKVFCMTENIDDSSTIPIAGSVPGNRFFSEARNRKMVTYRNKYLQYIEDNDWDADYLMVVDLDIQKLFPDAVFSSFAQGPEWDAVTAFGYSTSPKLRRRYHDTYIFQEWDRRGEPQTEQHMAQVALKYGSLKPGDPWVRVAAAFGGLAIYRFDAVKGLRYKVIYNNDEQVRVYGDHYSLYAQMIERGYDRFYLNPSMYLKYQRVTFSIAWNSLRRKLGLE